MLRLESTRGWWSCQFGGTQKAIVVAILAAEGGAQRLPMLGQRDGACTRRKFVAFQHLVAINIHSSETTSHVCDVFVLVDTAVAIGVHALQISARRIRRTLGDSATELHCQEQRGEGETYCRQFRYHGRLIAPAALRHGA